MWDVVRADHPARLVWDVWMALLVAFVSFTTPFEVTRAQATRKEIRQGDWDTCAMKKGRWSAANMQQRAPACRFHAGAMV